MPRSRESLAKGERAGIFRLALRLRRHAVLHRVERHDQPGILLGFAPADESQSPARPQRAAQVGEGRGGIGEEHHAKPRHENIRRLLRKILGAGVGEPEPRLAAERDGPFARPGEHPFGNVYAERPAALADRRGGGQRRVAAAAADVDDFLTLAKVRGQEQLDRDRRENGVLDFLPFRPFSPGGAVPVGDLVGVRGLGLVDHAGVASGLPFSTT